MPDDRKPKSPIPVDKEWFRTAIETSPHLRWKSSPNGYMRRGSQRQLAFKLGIDPAGLSLMLSGLRNMSIAEASEIAALLDQPLDEVIARAGGMRHLVGTIRTPSQIAAVGGAGLRAVDSDTVLRHLQAAAGAVEVTGWVDGCGQVHMEPPAGPRTVDRPPGVPSGSQALRLQSADMWDGWLVFYKPAARVGVEAVGQMCVVEREDGGLQLRFVQRGYEAGKWTIGGGLWPVEHDVALRAAAPVLWMKQR